MSGTGFSACVCLLLLLQCWVVEAGEPNQSGREFILGFMDLGDCNTNVEVIITTQSVATVTVVVTTPLFSSWMEIVTVNSTHSETVYIPCLVRGHGISKENKGVHVQADGDITVFGVNKEGGSADMYLALPLDVLGDSYWAVTATDKAELMIVGTQNDTSVVIELPSGQEMVYMGSTYRRGNPLFITLNRFETFHVYLGNASADLTGTSIRSNKSIAVLSGNLEIGVQGTRPSAMSHFEQMLLPENILGTRYITTHTPQNTDGDIFRIVATMSNTAVLLKGEPPHHFANAGDFWEVDIPKGNYTEIISNNSITVAMFSKSSTSANSFHGNPSMALLIPVFRYRPDYTWSTIQFTPSDVPVDFNNTVTVIIDAKDVDGLMLDGQMNLTWEDKEPIKESEKVNLWRYVTPGTHNLSHMNPEIRFFVLVSGFHENASYASPAGFGMGSYWCQISGDPHLRTFGSQEAALTIPCAYVVTRLRVLNLYFTPEYPFYDQIEMLVVAGNSQHTVGGRYYVSDVVVTVSFLNGTYSSISNKYQITENFTNDGDGWVTGNNDMQGRVIVSYDNTAKLATLEVTYTTLRVQFRPVNRHQGNHQHLRPGVFVKVGYDLIYDGRILFPVTMCSTVDDTTSVAQHAMYEDVLIRFIGIVTVLEKISYNIPGGDQDGLCPTLLGKLNMCSDDKKDDIYTHCFVLLLKPTIDKCFNAKLNHTHITKACNDCLDFHCTGDTESCIALKNFNSACHGINVSVPFGNCSSSL